MRVCSCGMLRQSLFAQPAQIRTADQYISYVIFFSLSDNSTEDNLIENGIVNQGNDFDDDSCEDAREEAPPPNTKKVLREMNFSRIS